MRCVLVTNSLGVGGVETNLLGLADAFRARGHDVRVVSSGGALLPELRSRGTRHVLLPVRLAPVDLVTSALALRRELESDPATIVHAMSAAANLVGLLRPRRDRPAYVSSPMGLAQSDREPVWKTDLRNRLLIARADRVLVISEEIERAVRRVGADPRRIRMCPVVGIDLARFDAAPADGAGVRAELGIPGDAAVVTTIGALHPRKRHDLFLSAAARIRDAVPDARFVIVGAGGEREALVRQARDLGIAEAVVFTGQRRDVRAILAATDVCVKPGIVEGFVGITVLEAMAARVPVVAFDTRDVRAAIVDGTTGLIVPRADTEALARIVVAILADRDLARRLATTGRSRVESEFAIGVVAERLEAAYAEAGA